VEPEIGNPGKPQGLLKALLHVLIGPPLRVVEDIENVHVPHEVPQGPIQGIVDRNFPPVAIFGHVQENEPVPEVNLVPSQNLAMLVD
jgi:hypothetical protein